MGRGGKEQYFASICKDPSSSDSLCCLTVLRRFVEERKSQLLDLLLITAASLLISCKDPAGGELVLGVERGSLFIYVSS